MALEEKKGKIKRILRENKKWRKDPDPVRRLLLKKDYNTINDPLPFLNFIDRNS